MVHTGLHDGKLIHPGVPRVDALLSSSSCFIRSHPTKRMARTTGHSLKSTPKYLDDSMERQNELGLVSKDSHCKAVVPKVYRLSTEIQQAEIGTGFKMATPRGACERRAVHENCISPGPKAGVIPLGLVNSLSVVGSTNCGYLALRCSPSTTGKMITHRLHATHPIRELIEAPLAHFEI